MFNLIIPCGCKKADFYNVMKAVETVRANGKYQTYIYNMTPFSPEAVYYMVNLS
jgi:hypothetical protein